MAELSIPANQTSLCKMTMSNITNSVKIGSQISEPFDTIRVFRQGDPLSCNLFNLIVESVHLFAYADDIEIIGTSKRAVSAAFSTMEWEYVKVGLMLKQAITKNKHSTSLTTDRVNT